MSKQFHPVLTLSVTATAALTARRFVSYAGAPAAAAAAAFGVTRTDGQIADIVAVDVIGTAIVEAGGAIAAGAQVEVNAAAKAVTKAAGIAVGRAMQAAAADGDFIEVLLLSN